MFSNFRRRRSLYRIVILLAVACIVILCFQFFLFGALDFYHHKESGDRKFERGPRPKHQDDVATFDKRIRRTTDKVQSVPLVIYEDCKDRNNCSRLVNLFDEQQKHYIREGFQAGKASVVDDMLFGHKDTSSFISVWQYLDSVYLVTRQKPGDEKLFLASRNQSTVSLSGVNMNWRHLYSADHSGFFTCPLSKVTPV